MKDINEALGYKISELGDVVNKNGLVLKKQKHITGYYSVSLSVKGVVKTYLIHRLVAKYYHENKNNKPCVNHKDGNKRNNHYKNIEWVTHAENNQHAYDNNLNTVKGVSSYDEFGNLVKEYKRLTDVVNDGHLSSNVCYCCSGKRKSHHNLIWKYNENNK